MMETIGGEIPQNPGELDVNKLTGDLFGALVSGVLRLGYASGKTVALWKEALDLSRPMSDEEFERLALELEFTQAEAMLELAEKLGFATGIMAFRTSPGRHSLPKSKPVENAPD